MFRIFHSVSFKRSVFTRNLDLLVKLTLKNARVDLQIIIANKILVLLSKDLFFPKTIDNECAAFFKICMNSLPSIFK